MKEDGNSIEVKCMYVDLHRISLQFRERFFRVEKFNKLLHALSEERERERWGGGKCKREIVLSMLKRRFCTRRFFSCTEYCNNTTFHFQVTAAVICKNLLSSRASLKKNSIKLCPK
jgi:hypothetical protein